MRRSLAILLPALLAGSGCYTTRVEGAPSFRAGPEQEQTQLFTLGGLVPLSTPEGAACTNGLAYAESELAVTDILIGVGVGLVGGAAGALICASGTTQEQAGCAAVGVTAAPLLFASRTVRYACVGGGAGLPPPPP